jgi:hypothetical protein
MTDDVNMHVEQTRTQMRTVAGLGHKIDGQWKQVKAQVTAGEAGIGSGRLAEIFTRFYIQPRDLTEIGVEGMAQVLQKLADAGNASANEYETRNNAAAKAFPTGPH